MPNFVLVQGSLSCHSGEPDAAFQAEAIRAKVENWAQGGVFQRSHIFRERSTPALQLWGLQSILSI